ncbi:MAG: histidinol phosphate phosphatase [Alphaproteobacteria bacterium]|nr:histidinol phosphate phosphatase [Alphaproteobacteria bacterium]
MQETIEFMNTLAGLSGSVIRKYFRGTFAFEAKSKGDPVTQADKETEEALRELIAKTYPADGIQGEEYGITKGTSGRVWVIDPIDGTRAFAVGRATFTTVIGLCENGVPVAGLLDQPIIGDRWIGIKGHNTIHNGQIIKTRKCPDMAQARTILTSPDMFKSDAEKRAYKKFCDETGYQTYGGDCYAYGLLASGYADAVLEASLKAHDIMGLVAIVEGAGGVITDWQGRAITLDNCSGQTLACGDKVLHQRLLALLTEA